MTVPENSAFPPLRQGDVDPDPIVQVRLWLAAAERDERIRLAETMILATANAGGAPSARAVLLKGLDADGFVFFTNYESRKGIELAENPRAALVFLWDPQGRQVRVEGAVERLQAAASEAYFRTRPRGSRLGAWASPQSRVIPDREVLERRLEELGASWKDEEVPLPPFWGGYRLRPAAIELWQHRDDRLHDRLLYRRDGAGGWSIARLAP